MSDDYPEIWLSPKCDAEAGERTWCDEDLGDCEEYDCQMPSVKYVRADRLTALEAENARLRDALGILHPFFQHSGQSIETCWKRPDAATKVAFVKAMKAALSTDGEAG